MVWLHIGWVALALIIGLVVWLKIIARVGVWAQVGQAGAFAEDLIGWGYHRAMFRFRCPGTRCRIDLVKRLPPGKTARVQMILERSCCSAAQFARVREALTRRRLEHAVVGPGPLAFQRLVVECGPDVEKAKVALLAVLTEGFGLHLDTALRVGCYGSFDLDKSRNPMIGWGNRTRGQSGIAGGEDRQG